MGPSEPLGDEHPSARSSGRWLQVVLFGIGGALFLGGLVTAGLPGAQLGMPTGEDTATPTEPGTPPASPTETAAPTPEPTASPALATPTSQPTPAVRSAGQVVHRVNVGGPQLQPVGDGPAWSSDRGRSPSQYLNARESDTVVSDTPDNVTLESDVPPTTPPGLFPTYRFERGADQPRYEEMVWRFPVDPNREYEVRLYVVEAFFTRGEPSREGEQRYSEGGPRTFGVAIENRTVLRNYEPMYEHGHDVGGVKTFDATTDDGTLVVRFLRERENPTVSGIEIVDTGPRTDRSGGTPSASRRNSSGGAQNGSAGPGRGTSSPRGSPGSPDGNQSANGSQSTPTPPPTPSPTPTEEDDSWWS